MADANGAAAAPAANPPAPPRIGWFRAVLAALGVAALLAAGGLGVFWYLGKTLQVGPATISGRSLPGASQPSPPSPPPKSRPIQPPRESAADKAAEERQAAEAAERKAADEKQAAAEAAKKAVRERQQAEDAANAAAAERRAAEKAAEAAAAKAEEKAPPAAEAPAKKPRAIARLPEPPEARTRTRRPTERREPAPATSPPARVAGSGLPCAPGTSAFNEEVKVDQNGSTVIYSQKPGRRLSPQEAGVPAGWKEKAWCTDSTGRTHQSWAPPG